jgi:large subunit ribosomal protein L24
MKRFHVRKGDEVVIIAGAEKGKRGRIISVAAKKERVIVEGARMIKKHMRKSQQNPQGAIVERDEGRGLRCPRRQTWERATSARADVIREFKTEFETGRSGKIRKKAK